MINKTLTIAAIAMVAVVLGMGMIAPAMAKPDQAADPKTFVRLVGTDIGETRDVPDIDGSSAEGLCFDLSLEDVKTGKIVGTATDCLSNVTPVGDGLTLVGTTTFNFNDGNQLVSRGTTTVQPVTNPDPTETPITHITGSIPNSDADNILSGTGKFQDTSGPVRLSGAVNMVPQIDGSLQITFDCMFVIDAEK
jgi:hypothetical protein